MRVLLVQSPVGRDDELIYPIGLAYLAGALDSHECFGIDLSLESRPGEALAAKIESVRPDVVAVSVRNIDDSAYPVTYWYLKHFNEVMDALGNWKGTVVVGGAGFSIYHEEILKLWPRIDIAMIGEGDLAFPRLLDHLEGAPAPDWLHGRIAAPPRPEIGLVPLPDYSVFPASDYPGRGAVGVQTRRGCVFNCAYCTYKTISGKGFRVRPVEHVVEDIREISRQGFRSFIFVDSVFDHPIAYCRKLIRALSAIDDIPAWGAWLSESIPLEDIDKLYAAGCRWVDFSPDVITSKGWKLMGKGGSLKRLWPVVKRARKAGLTVGVNFFSAAPGENFIALIRKFAFMGRARILLGWSNTFVNIGTIRLYRGAALAEKLYPEGDLFYPKFYRPRGPADLLIRLFQFIRRRRR